MQNSKNPSNLPDSFEEQNLLKSGASKSPSFAQRSTLAAQPGAPDTTTIKNSTVLGKRLAKDSGLS